MKYDFKLIKITKGYTAHPNGVELNISTFEHCSRNVGIFIFLSLNLKGNSLRIFIKPIGTLTLNKKQKVWKLKK